MKIGIVTFFCVPNYGAMLQSYALWKYLEGRGHDVEFIDYAFGNTRCIAFWKCFVTRNLHNSLAVIRKKLKSYVSFSTTQFSDTYPRTQRCDTFAALEAIGGKYDALIVGSDQMWNPAWCAGLHLPVVMLDFAHKSVKRISYAVSFGTQEWPYDRSRDLVRGLLQKFNAISVREGSGVGLVQRLSGRNDAKWLLDPTLLHQASFYASLMSVKKSEERYIFSYFLDEWMGNEDVGSAIEAVKFARGVDAVRNDRIAVQGALAPICKALKVQKKVAVSEWLTLIANADFIVTNSFHGVVFSILFHRPFIVIPVSGNLAGMNDRVTSLLGMLNLDRRSIFSNNIDSIKVVAMERINWDVVDDVLTSRRNDTVSFFSGIGL